MAAGAVGGEEAMSFLQVGFGSGRRGADDRGPGVGDGAGKGDGVFGGVFVVGEDGLFVFGVVVVAAEPIDDERKLADGEVIVFGVGEILGE